MKSLMRAIVMTLIAVLFVVPAVAQKKLSKEDSLKEISKLSKSKKPEEQAKAYELSKAFLTEFGKDTDENVKKVRDYVNNVRLTRFNKALDENKVAEGYEIGEEMLEDDPENVYVTMNLAYSGYDNFIKNKDRSFSRDSIDYAKQTIELFGKGKLPSVFAPFKSQADATALMYYVIATFKYETEPKEAVTSLIKAFSFDSSVKNNSYAHYLVANYYETLYEKGAKDFQVKHSGKTVEDAAMKADRLALEKVLDRMIDAYARTVKHGEAESSPNLEGWKTRLVVIYKFAKGSDKGLNELLATVLSTPFPEPL